MRLRIHAAAIASRADLTDISISGSGGTGVALQDIEAAVDFSMASNLDRSGGAIVDVCTSGIVVQLNATLALAFRESPNSAASSSSLPFAPLLLRASKRSCSHRLTRSAIGLRGGWSRPVLTPPVLLYWL